MSAPETGPARARTTRSWLVLALVASLAFNLVIVGAFVAEQMGLHRSDRGAPHRSFHLLPHQFFAGLERPRRDELRAALRANRPAYREDRRALMEAAWAFAEALERQPYDPSATQAAIAEHAGRATRLVDLGAVVAQDVVEALTPEERQALAAAIRHRVEQHRSRHRQ